MLLFIDADGDHSTGWEGYDLLVNESLHDGRRTGVRTYGRDDWGKPATIDYRYEGNELMVAVPRKFFGVPAQRRSGSFAPGQLPFRRIG